MERLQTVLTRIDGQGYKAYKQLQGEYQFPKFRLRIDHVQGDPFAEPSRCRILVDRQTAAIPEQLYRNQTRRTALEDYLGRRFSHALLRQVKGARGSGRSGEISMAPYGQQVLRRNSVLLQDGAAELRFQIALPAAGRSITATQARQMLFQELPLAVTEGILSINDHISAATEHVDSVEDQQHLRNQLKDHGLVAFIGDGSSLPRISGVDDHPLPAAVSFVAPDSMALELERIHQGPIRGMGIPQGVTLIVGGGFHGKSTLLHAIEYGVYDHIKSDGRELVVTEPSACKIRAEDGRAITGVDISPFINNLPQGKDTKRFSSQNASGSTSQAANIMEALAAGAHTLLIDEDTSASNFMIRDARMQALVAKDKEPITPLVQRIRQLYCDSAISVILVMGGSGDFFGCADHVIMLDNYVAKDVTAKAKALVDSTENPEPGMAPFHQAQPRTPQKGCLNPKNQMDKVKIRAFAVRALLYGSEEIDLTRVEQLADRGQLQAIGYLMQHYYERLPEATGDMAHALDEILELVEAEGLDGITPYIMGTLAMPRLYELAATINRMRNLKLV
jgi:predicted ABC-class ATPase